MKNYSEDPEILEKFEIDQMIGKGAYSEVYKAFDKTSKKFCALKIFSKEKNYSMNEEFFMEAVKEEIKIMKVCKSKNIVELYESFETKLSIVLVLELCDDNLETYLKRKKQLDFPFIQKLFKDLNNAIKILYENKIAHRDIKPENIFIKYENNHQDIIPKLGDFGISQYYQDEFEFEMKECIGTLQYMAPEIIKQEMYNYKCDLYSLGVVLYKVIFKTFPYNGNTEYALLHNMMTLKKNLKKTGIKSVDELIRGLLEFSPKKRLSMKEYLNHPFFKEDLSYLNKDNEKKIQEKEDISQKLFYYSKQNQEIKEEIKKQIKEEEEIKEEKVKNELKKEEKKEEIEKGKQIKEEKENEAKKKEKKELKKEEKKQEKKQEKKEEIEKGKQIKEEKKKEEKEEEKNEELKKEKKTYDAINNIVGSFPDIMGVHNAEVKAKENKEFKISNILYYDENTDKYSVNIYKDSDFFDRKTSGAFILCSNINSLKFVMEEIKYFNLEKKKKINIYLI